LPDASGRCANPQRAEEFANRMLGALNSSALVLMTSIGHRTGLFDALAANPDSTSAALARAARLNERYVREWLGAMVTGVSSSTTRGRARVLYRDRRTGPSGC
jgi:hypothetical protein